jgi:hypothetical protein
VNIENDPLASREQMVLPPIHIKIGLMEFYAKDMTRKISFAVPSKRVSTDDPCKDKIKDLLWLSQRAAYE